MALASGLELGRVFFVDPLFVAEFEVAQADTAAGWPSAPRLRPQWLSAGAFGILDEVGHVLRRFVHVECRDVLEAGGFAEVHEVEDAPAIRGIGIPRARVGRTPVARADHLLPAVTGVVDHRAAIAEHRDTLIDQPLGHVAAHGQALEAAPRARLQKRMCQLNGAGRLEGNSEPPAPVVGVWLQAEFQPLPIAFALRLEPSLCRDLPAVAAFERYEDFRGLLRVNPQKAFVRPAGNEVQAPVIQPFVFEAPIAPRRHPCGVAGSSACSHSTWGAAWHTSRSPCL